MKFNYDKIMQKKTVVYCNTEEKYKELLTWAHSQGLKWANGEPYIGGNMVHNEDCDYNIYFNFLKGVYCSSIKDISNNCTILEYKDVIEERNNE